MNERTETADGNDTFESSARALIQFVVRVAALPVTLPMTPPSALVRGAATGDYRPLPSPFLLALTAGVVVSGAIGSFGVFLGPNKSLGSALREYIVAVGQFYTQSTDGLGAILYAIPYIFALWIVAGIISFFMLLGTRGAEPIFAAISLCLAAMIEVFAVLFVLVNFSPIVLIPHFEYVVFIGISAYALILAAKLIRLVFLLRRENDSPIAGAVAASLPCLLIVSLLGLAGGVMLSSMVLMQRSEAAEKGKSEDAAAPAGAASPANPAAASAQPAQTP